MAFEELLNHKCNIYHLRKTEKSVGYGLKPSLNFSYPEEPDEKDVTCHFGIESFEASVKQEQPQNVLREKIKLMLPFDTDIQINDKVIDCDSKFEYTAEKPVKVRNHHIYVYIKRTKEQEAL
ncbi:MAG: DUF3599 family protein [Ruminococcus sp.]|nr:DUF3599 family protein [Ruminococcus sp.]